MNKIYEKIVSYIGSTWFILLFALWMGYNTYTHGEYIHFISEFAILLGLMILRAEVAQQSRIEKIVRKVLKEVK